MRHDTVQRRSLVERIFHTVCLGGIATVTLTPTIAWLMQHSVLEMGGLTILLATTVMIWNIAYNALFDCLWSSHPVKRTAKVRAFYALSFENGFTAIGVNIVAYVLIVSLIQAFMLKIGFFLFLLPYTMFYNWAYDTLRERVIKRHQQCATA